MNVQSLLKKGVPYVLIPGLLLAGTLGWKSDKIEKIKDYYKIRAVFPQKGLVSQVEDGDTFSLSNGIRVRLLGINAPDRGKRNYKKAKEKLEDEVLNRNVYLEYDRYQNDKYGRILAWVWVGCEKTPKFLPYNYMHKSNNRSKKGLMKNPTGCKKGKLVNEELVKSGLVKAVFYKDRGELKYQKRLLSN